MTDIKSHQSHLQICLWGHRNDLFIYLFFLFFDHKAVTESHSTTFLPQLAVTCSFISHRQITCITNMLTIFPRMSTH